MDSMMGAAVMWEARTSITVENCFYERGFVVENAFDMNE
jgi:hypothetical protein